MTRITRGGMMSRFSFLDDCSHPGHCRSTTSAVALLLAVFATLSFIPSTPAEGPLTDAPSTRGDRNPPGRSVSTSLSAIDRKALPQPSGVTFWNRLDGGGVSVLSELGPDLYHYDPGVDGQNCWCDIIGNVLFVPGRFGNAAMLGPGPYYSMARVYALVLRDLSAVLSPEQGTISVWYRESERPVPYEHNVYRIFDGGYGLGSPVYLTNDTETRDNLHFGLSFSGSAVDVSVPFSPRLQDWVHIAAVWDRDGIEGTGEAARLYIDGVQVGATTANAWGNGFGSNRADIGGGNDVMDGKYAVDNLVIYDYAKTDFSDRFSENPLGKAFAALTARADLVLGPEESDDSFRLDALFMLNQNSDGIDPADTGATVAVGDFSAVIPADLFEQGPDGAFRFKGKIDGAEVEAVITPLIGQDSYWLRVLASGVRLDGTVIPPNTQLIIGDDYGLATLEVGRARFGTGEDERHSVVEAP